MGKYLYRILLDASAVVTRAKDCASADVCLGYYITAWVYRYGYTKQLLAALGLMTLLIIATLHNGLFV